MKHYLISLILLASLAQSFSVLADETNYVQATIAEAYIELHTGPGRSYPIFYVAERGEKVKLLKQRTRWIKVRTSANKEGWVRLESIAKTNDSNGQPLTISLPQLEDFSNRRWEMGFMLGDFGGTDVITGYTGYHFNQNLSLELGLSENFGNFSSGQMATISVVNQPFPTWRYSPFVSLGGGVRKTNPRSTLVQTEDRTDDVVVVGAGIRVYLSSRIMLRLQYKNYSILTSRDDDIEVEEWKIGLSTFF